MLDRGRPHLAQDDSLCRRSAGPYTRGGAPVQPVCWGGVGYEVRSSTRARGATHHGVAFTTRLDRGAEYPITVVVGPPGCGKTVAVASWVAKGPNAQTVWMSCEERDADPVRFWHGAVDALQRRWPLAGADVRDLLHDDLPPLADVAETFAGEINAIGEPVCIVVDDLHLAKEATPSVGVAIEAQRAPARWVLVSRADPASSPAPAASATAAHGAARGRPPPLGRRNRGARGSVGSTTSRIADRAAS